VTTVDALVASTVMSLGSVSTGADVSGVAVPLSAMLTEPAGVLVIVRVAVLSPGVAG
jgi:hypothetical protein